MQTWVCTQDVFSSFQQQLLDLAAKMYERILFNLEYNYIFFNEDAQRQGELLLAGKYCTVWKFDKIFFQKGLLDLAATFYGKVLDNLDYDECMEGEEEERRVDLLKCGTIHFHSSCLEKS